MVKASPELSPVSLSFLGEETVLNSGGEVGAELGVAEFRAGGALVVCSVCVSFKIVGEWLKQNKTKPQHLFSW